MDTRRIAVIGAGHGGYAMAADLTLAGYEVNFYGSKERGNLAPVLQRGGIELSGVRRSGFARISRVTTEIAEAVRGAEIIMIATQAAAHETIAKLCAPYLEDGQTVVIFPGDLGSVAFAKVLREKGVRRDIKIAETETFPYGSRRIIGQPRVRILAHQKMRIAAFPAKDTKEVIDELKEIYPGRFIAGSNVLEVGLSNLNMMHVPICILNAGLIEAPEVKFYPYTQGALLCVLTVIEAIWQERGNILKALGLTDLYPFDRVKDFLVNSPPDRARLEGPTNMQHRFITEDCPFGLVPLVSLGDLIGIPTPITKALIALASEINETDYFKEGRTVERLGISRLSTKELTRFFAEGWMQNDR